MVGPQPIIERRLMVGHETVIKLGLGIPSPDIPAANHFGGQYEAGGRKNADRDNQHPPFRARGRAVDLHYRPDRTSAAKRLQAGRGFTPLTPVRTLDMQNAMGGETGPWIS